MWIETHKVLEVWNIRNVAWCYEAKFLARTMVELGNELRGVAGREGKKKRKRKESTPYLKMVRL